MAAETARLHNGDEHDGRDRETRTMGESARRSHGSNTLWQPRARDRRDCESGNELPHGRDPKPPSDKMTEEIAVVSGWRRDIRHPTNSPCVHGKQPFGKIRKNRHVKPLPGTSLIQNHEEGPSPFRVEIRETSRGTFRHPPTEPAHAKVPKRQARTRGTNLQSDGSQASALSLKVSTSPRPSRFGKGRSDAP